MADRLIPMPQQANVMAKTPSTTIILAEGVPFTPAQTHVRLFSGKSECLSYVQSKAVATITDSTPVRWGSYQYRGKYNQDDIKRCNYMAFKNPDSPDWNFAFITNIMWQSENSATISFILDVFQNDYYDCTWKPCYVEREHCYKSEDSVNFSMIPENLETGEIKCSLQLDLQLGNGHMEYIILASSTLTGEPPTGGLYTGIYSGLLILSASSYTQVNTIITNYVNAGMGDSIVAIYQVPGLRSSEGNWQVNENNASITLGNSIDGYTPKNQKTLQYPYHYAYLYGYQGRGKILKFELSNRANHQIDFKYKGVMVPTPAYFAYPTNYNGIINNYSEGFPIDGFPQCAWTNDSFQAYMVQNQPIWNGVVDRLNYTNKANVNSAMRGLGGQLLSGISSALSRNAEGTINTAYGVVSNTLNTEQAIDVSQYNTVSEINSQILSHDMIPPNQAGVVSTPVINTALNLNKISIFRYNVSADVAKTVDDFFSLYGYPVHKIKTPNTNSRSTWNYVKTCGCTLSGNVMQSDLQELRNIFDNGVTLWHTNDIGNYSLDNN